jgi:hypothetical protein
MDVRSIVRRAGSAIFARWHALLTLTSAFWLIMALLGTTTAAAAPANADPVGGAIAWAENYVGQEVYVNECLAFVHDAYLDGGGINIGSAATAVSWWDNHQSGQHAGDTDPPRGALVFWNATASNSAGHVGISLGNGQVISSYSYPQTTSNKYAVHVFSITARDNGGYPYLGWIAPPGLSLPESPLVLIKTKNSGTPSVQVFATSMSSGFQDFTTDSSSGFSATDANNGWFSLQDINGQEDLVFIKTRNNTGQVQVFATSQSSGFQKFVIDSSSGFSTADANNGWFSLQNINGQEDLVFIKTKNSGTPSVQVFATSMSSAFQKFVIDSSSGFSTADANNGWFQIGS